jgi:hypothetical protein
MKINPLSQKLKRAYLELEGENYDVAHYQQNLYRYLKIIESILPFSATNGIL